MSDIVTCPDCDTKLKMKAALPPGKKVRCPKCSTLFAPVSGTPKKQSKSSVDEEQVVTTVSKGRRNSVAAKREEEDDERPRRRQRPAVDEEDSEEPAEDERPRRPRKKRPRKSGNMALIVGLVIGGGVLLLLVGAGIVVAVVMGRTGPYKENQAAAKEMVACLEELASTMESVKDRNSAKTAAARINKICDRMENEIARAEKLPKLTSAENERLNNEMMPQINAINQRLTRVSLQAGAASQREPTFLAALSRLQQISNRLR